MYWIEWSLVPGDVSCGSGLNAGSLHVCTVCVCVYILVQ